MFSGIADMNDRIKLAKAMGWRMTVDTAPEQPLMVPPDSTDGAMQACPNPFTDANDCESLIAWLNKKGYEVDILFWPEGDATVLVKSNDDLRFFSEETAMDWKASIARAALKVIDDE